MRRTGNGLSVQPLESRCVMTAAPVLDTTPVIQLPTVLEDAVLPAGQVGTLVSSLVDTGGPLSNFSDADGDLPGIAITGVSLQGGTLWFSVDGGGSWLDVGPVSVASPRYLAANAFTRLYFQPGDNFNGAISDVISFKAWDRTGLLQQLGLDIDGEAAGDYSGGAVSLSADGMTVAIGAVGNDGSTGISTDNRGHVRVFRWNGTAWMQLGTDIDGDAASDRSGQTISLSADGKTLAITTPLNPMLGSTQQGHVRIYRWNGAAWMQLGADIDAAAIAGQAGWSASLSANGDILAMGVTRTDGNDDLVGYVRIYHWTGSAWTQLGTDIEDGVARSSLGQSVSLSADGITVAIGAPSNDGTNGTASGQTRIYRWSGTAWVQLGTAIDGESAFGKAGCSVALSADGSTVAIGAKWNGVNEPTGHVRVYRWAGTAWGQLGPDLDSEASGDESGSSVSISADGNVVAIGAPSNDGNGTLSGHVRIYRWTGTAWTLVTADIDGEAADDLSGESVSLSADGTTVAIGAPKNDGGSGLVNDDRGHVRVYRLVPQSTSVSTATVTVSVTVTNVNDAPTDITLSAASIAENAGANVLVGTLGTTDPDGGEWYAYSYELVPGVGSSGNASFEIVNNTLRARTSFNHERTSSFDIRVRSTDSGGAFVERTFTITVTDVDEAPIVDHVIAPVAGSYRAGQPLQFTAVLTQPVTQVGRGGITLPLVVGRARVNASLVGGLGSNRLTFRYVPTRSHNDVDGVALGAAIALPKKVFLRDAQGRNLAAGVPPTVTSQVLVDNVAPLIRVLAAPAAGTYGTGDVLTFTAVMSERVTVTGTPALSLKIGAANRLATYVSGSGTTSLVFRHVVQAGDSAARGITVGSRLVLAAAAVTDAAGNGITPTFRVPSTRAVLVRPVPRPSRIALQAAFACLE